MKKFKDRNVGTKLILKSLAILGVIGAVAFYMVISVTTNAAESSVNDIASALVEKNAMTVQAKLEEPLNETRIIAASMQGFKEIDIENRRNVYNNMLENVLLDNKDILGIWTCWEPNALDGLDKQFINQPGSDASGRFIPYWVCIDGNITLTSRVNYDQEGIGDYYLHVKNSGQETVLNPYEYEIGGQKILVTTLAVPIKDKNDKVVGVAGIDVKLNDLKNIEFDKGGYDSAYSFLASNNGTIVYHPKAEVVGKNAKDLDLSREEEVLAAVKNGNECVADGKDVLTGKQARNYYFPIFVGNTTMPWSIGISLEKDEIMAASAQTLLAISVIFSCIMLLIVITLYTIVKSSITKPIKATANFAKALASGKLYESVSIKSMDEIGQLTSTLDQEVRRAFIDIEKARAISEKQSAYQSGQVEKLVVNLERLSKGELYCDMSVNEPDEDTRELYELFISVNNNMHDSFNAIKGYIGEITYFLGKLAEGDLSEEIVSEYRGDFLILKESINKIIFDINSVFYDITISAEQVASGTRQVSDGSQEISQGATEQASSIEELSAWVKQIAAQTKQNAANAKDANELSSKSKDNAVVGNEKMNEMLKSMKEINESSVNISKIIKVIDDITFQTNILALNAAVEAARAGTHGKGFAVVAEEVRNLAARSADAAKETTFLIEGSLKKMEEGAIIADKTAEALANIVTGAEKAVELVAQIATASSEQATGIMQVNNGIEQLSKVVQINSAVSEESAAASEELSSQAELLKNMVEHFKLKDISHARKTTEMNTIEDAEEDKEASTVKEERLRILLNDKDLGKY